MNLDPSAFGTIDREHQVQIGLVRALCDAVRWSAGAEQTRQILEQVVAYSDVHFMSEQLLMRLCSYPGYDDHVLDHEHMMEMLRGVESRQAAGEGSLASNEAQDMLRFLSHHIATRDRQFAEYHLEWSRRAADAGKSAPEREP